MSKSLKALRKQWEMSTELVTETVTDNFVAAVCRVGSANSGSNDSRYWVYRYFKIANEWHVSADLSNGSVDAAFKAYTDAVKLKY